MKLILTAFALMMFLTQTAAGADVIPIKTFSVCAVSQDTPPARFDAPGCAQTAIAGLDPQGHDLWLRAHVKLSSERKPLGLYVSAKASSEAYVNGVRIGANGTPASTKEREIPGRMDAVFYIPNEVIRAGDNEITLRLSSFHGTTHLSRPVHWMAVAPFGEPVDMLLRAYWPSLVTFGVLLAGALFFAGSAISSVNRRDPLLLSLLSLLAAAQLFTEVYRGLTPYAYPVHDWRLIGIAGFSAAFGLTLGALIVARFVEQRRLMVFAGVALLTLTPLLIMPGFDGKAAHSLLFAAAACALIAGRAAFKGNRAGGIACLALLAFSGSILIFNGIFLDALFYFEVAAALLILFAVRAYRFERERLEHEQERMRAHDLELALARVTPAETTTLRINSAGSVNIVKAADITVCKGADDYVELHLIDGRMVLHSGALTDLETELPTSFLRVHRSFIVNTAFVKKLTRETTGTGVLTLSNGAQAPVSRRIMPKVRTALT